MMVPTRVWAMLMLSSKEREIPKSVSFTCPALEMRMLPGLTSRCTIWMVLRYSSPRAMDSVTCARIGSGIFRALSSTSCSEPPSMYSSTT